MKTTTAVVATVAAVVAAAAGVHAEWYVVAQRALLFGVSAVQSTVFMTGSEDSTAAPRSCAYHVYGRERLTLP
jgi:hypothetical protein